MSQSNFGRKLVNFYRELFGATGKLIPKMTQKPLIIKCFYGTMMIKLSSDLKNKFAETVKNLILLATIGLLIFVSSPYLTALGNNATLLIFLINI